jgi:ubiquitin C-terminal hydrolase
LANLGATCFLNATLQQFFSILTLRKCIIEYDGDDAFMRELRNLFARMLLSNGRLLSPEKLAEQWTGWTGERMNVTVQQDACEITQILIDRLEKGLAAGVVHDLLGGTTVDTIDGMTEDYHTTHDQPFYTFNLPIENAPNSDAGFEKFQNVDFFTGGNQYSAEELGRKIDAKKFASLGRLPPILIIQLGRFTYNFQNWEQTKIDTPFEFPVELDVERFTAVDHRDQVMTYRLCGVVVHSGSAAFGHYISLVRSASGSWLSFNDAIVTEISEAEALEMSYGRTGKTGYLLFYQRTDFVATDEPQVSNDLAQLISEENRLNDEYRLFCSSPYYEFMKVLARSPDPRFQVISLHYYFDTFPTTTHVAAAHEFTRPLISGLRSNAELRTLFVFYLATNGPFQTALIYAADTVVRESARELLLCLLPSELPEQFLPAMLAAMSSVIEYCVAFNQYFEMLDDVVVQSEAGRLEADESGWG